MSVSSNLIREFGFPFLMVNGDDRVIDVLIQIMNDPQWFTSNSSRDERASGQLPELILLWRDEQRNMHAELVGNLNVKDETMLLLPIRDVITEPVFADPLWRDTDQPNSEIEQWVRDYPFQAIIVCEDESLTQIVAVLYNNKTNSGQQPGGLLNLMISNPGLLQSYAPGSAQVIDRSSPSGSKPLSTPGGQSTHANGQDVSFTAYFPSTLPVEQWSSIAVYAHLDSALAKVAEDAARLTIESPRSAAASGKVWMPIGQSFTVVPTISVPAGMPPVLINPPELTLKWYEDLHRADFRVFAPVELESSGGQLRVDVRVGPIIVATIRSGLLFGEQTGQPISTPAQTYRDASIFLSYSHRDSDIVRACHAVLKSIGFNALLDKVDLRAGQPFDSRIQDMIAESDLFQFFWSPNSRDSDYCKLELDHALAVAKKRGLSDFVRPVSLTPKLAEPIHDTIKHLHFSYLDVKCL